jgi:transcriptional regulator with XRE-family HTH domain
MSRESVGDQEELREMLHFFLNKMGATQVELSEGMGVSRPVVIEFLNKEKERLPVDSEGLIKLCESLYKRRASKRKSKREGEKKSQEIEYTPDELRKLLGEIGADELLESAGFLPKQTRIIRVTPERFFQVAQVAALLELLEFEDLLSTTQEFLAIASNKIAIASKKLFWQHPEYQENDLLGDLIENLWKSYPTLGLKLRLKVIEKLRRTWERLKAGGKTNFTQQEAIALFLSIAIKEQMPKDAANLHIRVKKLEFQTLSRSINQEEKYSDVYHKFVQIGNQAERDLNTPGACSTTQLEAQSLDSLNPVIMAAVTCSFSYDDRSSEILEWMYTSSNTMLENAISACSLHLGLTKEVANITLSTKTLDSSIDALVETTVILGNQQQYQGIWVDRDSMIAMLQAIVTAAKQWLADLNRNGGLNLEKYSSVCKVLSDLRKRLTRARKAFQNFQFLNEECQSAEIKRIADTAMDELKKIPKEKIYFSYRLNFYRCYFLAKRLELRLSNFQGNISNVELLIQEIKEVLEKDQEVKEELVPIQALIQSEDYLYKLSCGHEPDLFESSKRSKWLGLEGWDSKIRGAIKPGSCYKDPGLDVYQALSEIYGNTARMEFYLSDEKNTLEEAAAHFLRAAHYALRIGLTQRMARWLALAGRVWVRLGDSKLSIQALSFAEKLAKADLTAGHSNNFCQAVLSEIYLLEGEYLLLIKDDATKALERFLEALKGSVYLGLNRRICDALFNISRCSKKLGNFSIKEGLSRVFKEEDQLTESNKSKLNPMSNHTSEKVLDLLCSLWSGEDNPTWFQVRGEFSRLAAETWQGWHRDTSEPGATTKHPIAERIESESWLCQV